MLKYMRQRSCQRRDELKRPLDIKLPSRGEDLADEAAIKVLHKGDRSQDRPVHLGLGLRDQVLLNAVLAGEVRDVCRVVDGSRATAVN